MILIISNIIRFRFLLYSIFEMIYHWIHWGIHHIFNQSMPGVHLNHTYLTGNCEESKQIVPGLDTTGLSHLYH